MKKLPEELTAELLGLILRDDVYEIVIGSGQVCTRYDNCITWAKESGGRFTINIDTLTRLMKEWCWKTYKITIRSGYAEFGAWSNFAHNNISFVSMDVPFTEFEAVLKATNWAKTKGI